MTKKFNNIADDGHEKAIRKGFSVPNGAVNLAWAQAPDLSPANNVVIIDTSKVVSENQNIVSRRKRLAFANALGILEDENGNQIWDEEYPIISDVFTLKDGEVDEEDYIEDVILPYAHVSRFFHVDFAGLAFGSLEQYLSGNIKVVNKNGLDYVDENGKKKYKIYLIQATNIAAPANTQESAYRVYAFLDMNVLTDELYLAYNKVELNTVGSIYGFKNQESGYRELINARQYFKYDPEETNIIDHSNSIQKIFSTKPSNLKQQILGLPQPNYTGWKYYVPRKAIPDPRIFQLFRWRLACEITKATTSENTGSNLAPTPIDTIKVGIVITTGCNHFSTRANYLFYQMNNSDFNFSGIKFINPLKTTNYTPNDADQRKANYWHVDISTISLSDLKKFDILVWAPSADSVDVSPHLPKINYFVENLGKTFIFETSSYTNFANMPDITFSPSLTASLVNPSGVSSYVEASTLRMFDATPDNQADTFSSFGMWKVWPPNIADILNNYNDIGSILSDSEIIAGWTLTEDEKNKLSGYTAISNANFQYINSYASSYSPVTEAKIHGSNNYSKTLVHRKHNSGGNIFISTSCLFEDHLFEVNGDMASRSLQIENLNDLDSTYQTRFKQMISSQAMEGEMKLRLNACIFSTLNKPSCEEKKGSKNPGISEVTAQTMTIFSDWYSSWVINPLDGVLSENEKAKYNFAFLPTTIDVVEPTWQRVLSDKTVKQIIQEKINQTDPNHKNQLLNSFDGATRRYFMITTNPLVQVFTTDYITDDTIPSAWTTAYSPAFNLPTHIGSYVVRDEMIAGTGVGNSGGKRIYPQKPYKLRSSASFINTTTTVGTATATISLSGTYVRYIRRPDTTQTRSEWVPPGADTVVDVVLHWNTDGSNQFENLYTGHSYFRQGQWPKPIGIDTWSSANYVNAQITNFPYPGLSGTLDLGLQAIRNTRSPTDFDFGVMTTVAQKMLNQLMFFGAIPGGVPGTFQGLLPENGIYTIKMADTVTAMQRYLGAKNIDGVIDAEAWSLLGYQQIGISNIPGWWDATTDQLLKDTVTTAKQCMMLNSISDDNPNSVFMTHSNYENGPNTISEAFHIKFNESFPIYKVSIMPFCSGMQTNDLVIDWVDVSPRTSLVGYDFYTGSPGWIAGKHAGDGQWININVDPVLSNSVVFRATQSGPAGYGTTRIIGIRDVAVYGKKIFPGAPGYYKDVLYTVPGSVYSETIPFTYETTVNFTAGIPIIFRSSMGATISPPPAQLLGESGMVLGISDMKWTPSSLTISPSDMSNSFKIEWADDIIGAGTLTGTTNTENHVTLTYMGQNNSVSAEIFINGPKIGDGSNVYYTKSKSGSIDPYSRTYGWIQKDDGVKLICNSNGTPYGFPVSLPIHVTTSTHFTRYKLSAFEIDQTIHYGFYDVREDEYITNSYGEPEISYLEYVQRGPQNIYIAVSTDYEINFNSNIPGSLEPVMRPFKWGMPVYGVTSGMQAKIQIESLSPNLSHEDVWAIPIKCGFFGRTIPLTERSFGSYTSYLKDYQGSTVRAFYSIPEANNGPWSALYGRPYIDIKGEIPLIIDDDTIRIKQSPILIVQIPTDKESLADPWIPVFTVYRRETLTSPWYVIPFTDISDYNIWNGTIILKTRLTNNDPRLIKVDYTSNRNVYYMKTDGSTRINLNPYINNRGDWTNKPLYIYIIPEYILDSYNTLISLSVQSRTIHATTDPSIFSQNQPNYDPTAILLGIIYISSALDINKLSILDTRKRGGGISTAYSNRDIFEVEPESESYWDIIPEIATSYQKGGYVIVRLPATMRDDFTLSQIRKVIERNLTIGIGYELQDLQGNRWSQ